MENDTFVCLGINLDMKMEPGFEDYYLKTRSQDKCTLDAADDKRNRGPLGGWLLQLTNSCIARMCRSCTPAAHGLKPEGTSEALESEANGEFVKRKIYQKKQIYGLEMSRILYK